MLVLTVDNKDKLDDIIITEDTILNIRLKECQEDINIDVMDNMCLEVFELDCNTSNKIVYNLRENAQVIVNKLSRDNSDVTTINLNGANANIKYYSKIMNYGDNTYQIDINHLVSHTSSAIYNHCVNFTDKEFKFLVSANITKNAVECSCNQDNKIIDMGNGKNYISPNLLVDNNLINANHSAYIGKFKQDVIFYMKSRGLSDKDCEFLLIKGLLLGNMNLDEKNNEEYVTFINDNFQVGEENE